MDSRAGWWVMFDPRMHGKALFAPCERHDARALVECGVLRFVSWRARLTCATDLIARELNDFAQLVILGHSAVT